MILKITRLPLQYPTEEACSPVSFTFWYSLQDEFEAMTLELQQNWGRLVHTLFFQFIEGLIVKLRLPELSQFSAEEKESYRVYRIDCSDALMYVYNLLNQSMLQFMADSVAHKRLDQITTGARLKRFFVFTDRRIPRCRGRIHSESGATPSPA